MSKYWLSSFLVIAIGCGNLKTGDANKDLVAVSDSSKDLNESMVTTSNDSGASLNIESYFISQASPTDSIVVITEPCAVYVHPADSTVERLQKEYGEDFATIGDDVNWYNYQSWATLDTMKVKHFNLGPAIISFTQSNGQKYLINGRAQNNLSPNLFFFNPNKKPKVLSTIEVTKETVKDFFDLK